MHYSEVDMLSVWCKPVNFALEIARRKRIGDLKEREGEERRQKEREGWREGGREGGRERP
jgi:hypothetical protein